MLILAGAILMTSMASDAPARLRTILPNRAVVLVERFPDTPTVTVDVWLSAGRAPETSARHGWRHLAEHFIAVGPDPRRDARLETAGAFLAASTRRDAMTFSLRGPLSSWPLLRRTVSDLVRNPLPASLDLPRELRVMSEEARQRTPDQALIADAYRRHYPTDGLDGFGDLTAMGRATNEDLTNVTRATFQPDQLTVVVSGNLNVDQVTRELREALATWQPDPALPLPGDTAPLVLTRTPAVLSLPISDVTFRSTATAMSAGLALASEVPGGFFHVGWLPRVDERQPGRGVVAVGRRDAEPLDVNFDRLDPVVMYNRGRSLLTRFLASRLRDPAASAALRAELLNQGAGLRPEMLQDHIPFISFDEFSAAWDQLRRSGGKP